MIDPNNCRIFVSGSFQNMWNFYQEISDIIKLDRIVEKYDYLSIINKYQLTFNYLQNLENDNLIKYACNLNNISYIDLKNIMNIYFNIDKIIEKKNYVLFINQMNNEKQLEDNSEYSFKGYSYAYIISTILNCLIEISKNRCYGVSTLAYILKGEIYREHKSIDIIKISFFGKLSQLSIEHINALIYWLIKRGYINQTKTYMPKIKVTYMIKDFKHLDNEMINEIKEIFSKEIQTLL